MVPRISAISYPTMNPPMPDAQSEKQEYVRSLFDGIARRYDFLNHFLSFGFDVLWRRRTIRLLSGYKPKSILDLATGTADMAIAEATTLKAAVVGVDLSQEMLTIAREKVRQRGLADRVSLRWGRAEALDFASESFDAVTVAFGVRNYANVGQGLREMHRVLRPGGIAMILEFSRPGNFLFGAIYGFYFQRILPLVGGLVSRNRASYEYLPNSVRHFPDGADFLTILQTAGFTKTELYPLTLGIATIYLGFKGSNKSE